MPAKWDFLCGFWVNNEFEAPEFWRSLHDRFPAIHASLKRDGEILAGEKVREALASLPGWGDGEDHPLTLVDPADSDGDIFR